MPIANFAPVSSLYDYQVQENLNDLSVVQLQWDEDAALLSTYKEQKSDTQNIGLMIKNEILKSIEELRATKDELEKELEEFAGVVWDEFSDSANQSAMDIFNQIFDPLMQAITPLMDLVGSVGLPEVPIIGNLQSIIQKIAKTGQLISRLPREVRNAAREEAEKQKKAHKELAKAQADTEEAERKYKQVDQNMTWWDRQMDDFKNSPIGKILLEIVEVFIQVIEVLKMICQCAVYAALIMLLEKLKPLLQQLGTIISIITNALTVMKMLMFSSAQLIRFFYKVLEEKLSELWNIVRYVIDGGWSMPVNGMISAIHADMICCEFEMSSINMEMGRLSLDHIVDIDTDTKKKWEKREKQLQGEMESELNSQNFDRDVFDSLNYKFTLAGLSVDFYDNVVKMDKDNLDEYITEVSAFNKLAPGRYKLELEKRTAEDDFLKNNHEAIKKDIAETQKLTGAARTKAARQRRKTAELKEQKAAEAAQKATESKSS